MFSFWVGEGICLGSGCGGQVGEELHLALPIYHNLYYFLIFET